MDHKFQDTGQPAQNKPRFAKVKTCGSI
jgi:hypothetical protein